MAAGYMDSTMSNDVGHEAQPLLEEQDDLPPVYDIIHQIRQVSLSGCPPSSSHSFRMSGRDCTLRCFV
jgi:hypothetical protein